jgi:hypothetical protein
MLNELTTLGTSWYTMICVKSICIDVHVVLQGRQIDSPLLTPPCWLKVIRSVLHLYSQLHLSSCRFTIVIPNQQLTT